MTPERLQEIEDYVATVEYATMNQALGLIAEVRRLTAERDEARKDMAFHAECRPNRRQAEAAMADAKATNDRWADEVVLREQAEATIATLRAERDEAIAAHTIMSKAYADADHQRTKAEATIATLREQLQAAQAWRAALVAISDMLPCERPCRPEPACPTCGLGGYTANCAGCMARAALAHSEQAHPTPAQEGQEES